MSLRAGSEVIPKAIAATSAQEGILKAVVDGYYAAGPMKR